MPGVLNSQPSSADKERKGQRTEAPGEKTKATQRIRLQFACAGCRQPGPAGTGLSASSGAGPNQRQSLAPAADLWLLRVNPEQVRSGTSFLTHCLPISTGPASISSRVWGSVLTCFYCLLIIVFSLKRKFFFDKLKTSLCNKNAFRLSEQSLHLKNISGKDATVESSSHSSGQYLSINQEQQFLLKTQSGV